jgi:hypothetical protein
VQAGPAEQAESAQSTATLQSLSIWSVQISRFPG